VSKCAVCGKKGWGTWGLPDGDYALCRSCADILEDKSIIYGAYPTLAVLKTIRRARPALGDWIDTTPALPPDPPMFLTPEGPMTARSAMIGSGARDIHGYAIDPRFWPPPADFLSGSRLDGLRHFTQTNRCEKERPMVYRAVVVLNPTEAERRDGMGQRIIYESSTAFVAAGDGAARDLVLVTLANEAVKGHDLALIEVHLLPFRRA